MQYPIHRFPYASMESLHMDKSKQQLIFVIAQVVKMKAFNVGAPYAFMDIESPIETNGLFVLEPSYSRLDDFVGLIAKIYQLNRSQNLSAIRD